MLADLKVSCHEDKFSLLTATARKIKIFWHLTRHRLVNTNRHFDGCCCLRFVNLFFFCHFSVCFLNSLSVFGKKGKCKAVPLQASSGREGSRKLRFPDFMTTAQVGGKVVSLTHRPPLPAGNAPGTHFC